MKINNLETLLLQEMEEVKGGDDIVCHCPNGGAISMPAPGCSCSTLAGEGVSCTCNNSGALSTTSGTITPTPTVPDKPEPVKP